MDLLVLAKEPRPGQVKTRLTPPCTPEEAADIARGALADTLAAAVASGATRVILGLDGEIGGWCPPGVHVVEQGSGQLSDRLATLWSHTGGPALQIGMDTPQVTAGLLDDGMAQLAVPGTDAVLGLARDGGWWALGQAHPDPTVFQGIPTSRPDTGARQLRRLADAGGRASLLPPLQDVDHWNDALAVAVEASGPSFPMAVARVAARIGLGSVERRTAAVAS